MNVLIVAAHPDDEVLGCGGTAAKLSAEGHAVYCAIMGQGIASRNNVGNDFSTQLDQLHSDAKNAADILGFKKIQFFDFPDNRFDSLPLLDLIKPIESLIEKIEPTVVYTHHPSDLNIDHCYTFRAVLTAIRPMQGTPVKELYSFEIPSSTEWSFGKIATPFSPNTFLDIENTLETKIKAMEQYSTEKRSFPHPRSQEALQAVAKHWGSTAGLLAAEPFELIFKIG